jgi:hypothetical protein
VGIQKGLFHLATDGAGHEEKVRVSRRSHEPDPVPFRSVIGSVHRVELELAGVAGTGIDVTD